LFYQAIIKGKRLDLNLKIISLNLCENHNFPPTFDKESFLFFRFTQTIDIEPKNIGLIIGLQTLLQ
jgi:hypothetical protein